MGKERDDFFIRIYENLCCADVRVKFSCSEKNLVSLTQDKRGNSSLSNSSIHESSQTENKELLFLLNI